MTAKTYYLSKQGQQLGPLGLEQILQLMEAGELQPADLIYDDVRRGWIVISQFGALASEVTSVVQNTPKAGDLFQRTEWFVLQKRRPVGPFKFVDILKLLQEKSLFEDDYVWSPHLLNWTRVADVSWLSRDNVLRAKFDLGQESSAVFHRRRYMRLNYEAHLSVHNGQSVWRATCTQISAGGAGLFVHTSSALPPGNRLKIHFEPSTELPAFNVNCEIVSRRKIVKAESIAAIQYGVKFFDIHPMTRQRIESLAKKQLALK